MRLLIFILSCLFCLNAFSDQLTGKISPVDEGKTYEVGDIDDFVIQVWPTHQLARKQYLFFEGLTLFERFYIISIYSQEMNPNNSDVWEVKVQAAIGPAYEVGKELKLNRFGSEILFSVEPWMNQLKDPKQPQQKYQFVKNVFKTPFDWDSVFPWIVLLIVLLLLLSPFILRKLKEMKKRKIEEVEKKKRREHWRDEFNSAKERKDFEEIALGRKEWIELCGGETVPIRDFFSILDLCQYKVTWTEEEFEDVSESFGHIRDIFDDGI